MNKRTKNVGQSRKATILPTSLTMGFARLHDEPNLVFRWLKGVLDPYVYAPSSFYFDAATVTDETTKMEGNTFSLSWFLVLGS